MTTDDEPDADRPEETENAPTDETAEAVEPVDGDQAEEPAEEGADEPGEDQEPEAEEGDDDQAEESTVEPGEDHEPAPEVTETQGDGDQTDETAEETDPESGEEQAPEAEVPETEEGDQAEGEEEGPEEEATADAAEPETEAEAQGEETEPAPEREMADDDLPEAKRGGEEAEIDEGELGEKYELPEDVAGGAPAAPADELASDQAPGAEQIAIDQAELGDETFVPPEAKGRSPVLVVIQILLFVAVVGMVYAVLTKKSARQTSEEAETPATLDYKYTTKTGAPERVVEEAIAPLLGDAAIKSLTLTGDKKGQCEIVLNLPLMYLEGNDELKKDAEMKAVDIVKAALAGVASLEEITFKAMGALSDENLEEREVALQVVASRAAHAKADYSGGPAAVLMLFKTTYHKALQ